MTARKTDGQMRSLTATTALKGPCFSVITTSLGRTADAPDFGLSTHQRDNIIARKENYVNTKERSET